jgi:hypothetical protein
MSRYILNEGYALRGWKGLPFALRYPDPHKTEFFDKESYRVVYALDGVHDIDEAAKVAGVEWDNQFQYCTENHYRRIYPRDGSDAGFPDCAASVEEGSHCGTNDACGQSAVVYTGFRVDCLMLNCTKAWK